MFASFALAALLAVSAGMPLHAQEWPQRPVKIVVPDAAGENSDTIARILATRLGNAFAQPFTVENRPGAAGVIAAESVARAPADGYTLLLAGAQQIAIAPATMRTSVDPLTDLVPISLVATNSLVLAVSRSLPVNSLAEFVNLARNQRGQLTYAAGGVGSINHLAMVSFAKRAGIEMTPVMYKRNTFAVTDLAEGRISALLALVSDVMPQIDKLRILAAASEKRVSRLPDVPTMIESEYAGFALRDWTGLMAPAGLARATTDRIAAGIARAVKDPEIAAKLTALGFDPVGGSADEFAAVIAADIPLWRDAVKSAGLNR